MYQVYTWLFLYENLFYINQSHHYKSSIFLNVNVFKIWSVNFDVQKNIQQLKMSNLNTNVDVLV